MKNQIKTKILALTCAILAVFAAGCGSSADSSSTAATTSAAVSSSDSESSASENSSSEVTAESESSTQDNSETSSAAAEGLWANAKYTDDTELGEGAKTIEIEVAAEDKKITLKVHTDSKTLGDVLTENKIAEGNKTEYGLYITAVNGMTADYDKDKAYWAISKNGEYSQTGADSTNIADGEHYELTYTKE